MAASKQPFELVYDQEIRQHLAAIERKHHSLIRQTITEQLTHEPNIETRNRKPLTSSAEFGEATWEIRFGPNNRFRVFYRTDEAKQEVRILAVGVKKRNELWIGGERFEL
ncbi:MAG: addiction module toxin RelE [Chloroflexi bacterium]|nr:MAG: addiction module toxin RelE [Chloroflexota bacterium]